MKQSEERKNCLLLYKELIGNRVLRVHTYIHFIGKVIHTQFVIINPDSQYKKKVRFCTAEIMLT